MKNLKKLMSVILTVAMLMSLVVSTSAATFTDVAETDNAYEAVEVLAALGILEGKDANNFDPDANIKRSEFAAVVCRAMNAEAAAAGSAGAKFTDVPATHWAAGYIAWAADAKIVNGRGDGTFDPDANVTYQEATKMIVAAMGWAPYAENTGGYPTGYMTVANKYDMFDGIKVASYGAAADRKGVAQLVFNAFDAPLLETVNIYFGEDPHYEIHDGKTNSYGTNYPSVKKTLLSAYHEIYKLKVEVEETYKSLPGKLFDKDGSEVRLSLVDDYYFDEDAVKEDTGADITKSTFDVLVGELETADLIGYEVNAYIAMDEEEEKPVLLAAVTAGELDEIVIDNPSVFIKNATATEVEYWEDLNDATPAKAELKSAVTYVNGAKKSVAPADFAKYDKVVLIGEDEEYDKVMLTEYVYALVDEIDAEYFELKLDGNRSIVLDPAEIEEYVNPFYVNIYKDGAAIDFEDIAEGDLLNIVANDDIDNWASDPKAGIFADIYVTNNVVEGSVDMVSDDATPVYTIDGEDYYIVGKDVAGASRAQISSLEPGEGGEFVLTITGDIYDAELTKLTSGNYALILAAGVKDGDFEGEGKVLAVKVLDKNNNEVKYTLKENASVTAKWNTTFEAKTLKTADHETLKNMILTSINGAKYEELLVTFKAVEGEITHLTFAGAADLNVAPLKGELSTGNRLAGNRLTDATVIFNIPNDSNNKLDLSRAQVYTSSALVKDKTYEGNVYDVEKKVAGAVLLKAGLGFAGSEDALAVVTSISTGIDEEGYETKVLNFYQAGETKSIAQASKKYEGDSWANLTIGDVVQYTTNAAGDINDLKVILNLAAPVAGKLAITGSESCYAGDSKAIEYKFGKVIENEADYIDLSDGSSLIYDLADNGTNVLFDTTKSLKAALGTKTGTSYLKPERNGVSYYVLAKVEDDAVLEIVAYKIEK